MLLIGHERQHAVEVLENPKIVDANTLYHLYWQIGRTASERFETLAAEEMGFTVFSEAAASRTCR
jgi:hypothetical protein